MAWNSSPSPLPKKIRNFDTPFKNKTLKTQSIPHSGTYLQADIWDNQPSLPPPPNPTPQGLIQLSTISFSFFFNTPKERMDDSSSGSIFTLQNTGDAINYITRNKHQKYPITKRNRLTVVEWFARRENWMETDYSNEQSAALEYLGALGIMGYTVSLGFVLVVYSAGKYRWLIFLVSFLFSALL